MELSYLRESRMISTSHTKSRFTLWTAAALLAVILALVLPQSALAAPDRPTGLTATALDHDTVSLTWSQPNEENVDHYQVLRGSSGESRLSQIATTQTTYFQDDGLQPETTYTYRVRAMDSEGARSRRSVRSQTTTAPAPTITPVIPAPEPTPEHAQAKEDESDEQGQTITPRSSHIAAPANLRVTNRTVNSITFGWNAPTDSTVTHTYIKYVFSGNTTANTHADVRTSFAVVSVPQNTHVDFTVAWATGSGMSNRGRESAIVPKTLEDKQAQNLRESEKTAESVRLIWENPSNYNVTGYEVQRRTGNSGSFTTLVERPGQSTGFTDTTVSANTTYSYRVTIKYLPSGESSPINGNDVDLDVTTPGLSDVGAPINFRVTNATLTNGVYVLDNHDDDPVLDWEYTPITITITETDDGVVLSQPFSYQGYEETGFKFTRKWIDSDATCGANCPWLLAALYKGAGHTHFTDDLIAPGTYIFRIRALDENNNPGAAAEITVRLPDAPAFVLTAPTNFSVTAGRYGLSATLEGSWGRVDTPYYQTPPAFIVQWKSGNQDYNTAVDGNRSLINAWSGPQMLGADGNDQWSPAWNKFNLRSGFTPGVTLALNTTYTMRVGMCLTTSCDLDDVAFASERTVTTPVNPNN